MNVPSDDRPSSMVPVWCRILSRFAAVLPILAAELEVQGQAPGTLDPLFTVHADNDVLTTVLQPDGKILLGGAHATVNDSARPGIARLLADGTLEGLTTFDPGTGAPGVQCVAVLPDGKILIGGSFTSVSGQPRGGIARLHADGSVESSATFKVGAGVSGRGATVHCVAVQLDGKILLGGDFSSVDGQPRGSIARLHSDGSLESTATFNVGSGADGTVNCVVPLPPEYILLGGRFTTINGRTRNGFTMLHKEGGDNGFTSLNPGAVVNCMVLYRDRVLLAGEFTSVNGQTRRNLARVDFGGSLDSLQSFNASSAPAGIQSMSVQADGKIIIGGSFTTANGQPRNRIARLGGNGQLEFLFGFNTSSGPEGDIDSLALQPDGKVLIGGRFSSFNGQTHNHLARLQNNPATGMLTLSESTGVQWARGGSAPEIDRVTFDLSTDEGITWSPLGSGLPMTGGWERSVVNLPAAGLIRARGLTSCGLHNGSSGIVEATLRFPPPPPDQPEIAVSVAAAAGSVVMNDGQLEAIDFGRNASGTPGLRDFTISNTGTAPLRIHRISVPHGYSVPATPVAPFIIGAGAKTTIQIRLVTFGVGHYPGSVLISSNDLDEDLFDFPVIGEVFAPNPGSGVVSSATTLNRQTGLREQTIHISNDTTSMVPAYYIIIRGLPPGVEVNNASETRADGSVVVYIRQGMAPRSLQDIILEYYSPTRAPVEINPQLSTEVILNPLDLTVPAGGEGLAVENLTRLTGGDMLLQFTTVPGRRYEVQFSRDGQSWQVSLPSIRAASNRTQWLDRGLPRTDRHPAQDTSRFYRVREVAP